MSGRKRAHLLLRLHVDVDDERTAYEASAEIHGRAENEVRRALDAGRKALGLWDVQPGDGVDVRWLGVQELEGKGEAQDG